MPTTTLIAKSREDYERIIAGQQEPEEIRWLPATIPKKAAPPMPQQRPANDPTCLFALFERVRMFSHGIYGDVASMQVVITHAYGKTVLQVPLS